MERIAPLAKILAEANGIDWQQLRGTGDGGMIVEQDILNYLSRIMSGEEEPPSTPVDVPPPDWNGDVNAMPDLSGISADQMARAGVESDITALLGHASPAPSPEVPATTPAAPLDDDLEFELDDVEPETPAPAPAMTPAPATPSLGGWEWNAATPSVPAVPDLSAGMDAAPAVIPASVDVPAFAPTIEVPTVQMPDVTTPAVSAPAFHFDAPTLAAATPAAASHAEPAPAGFMAAAPAPAEPAPAEPVPVEPMPAPAAGLGSLLSRLYQQPAAPAPAPAPAEPQPAMDTTAFPAPMDTDAAEEHSGPVLDTGTAWPAPATATHDAVAPDAPTMADAPAHEAPLVAAPVPLAPEPAPAPDVHAAPQDDAPVEAVHAGPAHSEPAHSEPAQPEAQAAARDVTPVPAMPVAMPQPGTVQSSTDQPSAAQPASPTPAGGDAVWFGTYLRRDVDVSTLTALHGQITAALGQTLPLGLLVARAAQRHVADLGLGTVALHGGGSARSVAGDTLRAAADAAHHDYHGTPDLLVVDAGAHGLDDLHYPHTTTLSFGRVQDGRAALTLNGTVDAAQGAAFLAAVADTLGQPVLLLL